MSIDYEKSAKLNGCTVEELKVWFERYPKSNKKIVAICDNPDCEGNKIRIIRKRQYYPLCKSCAMKKYYDDPKAREKNSIAQLKRYEDLEEHEKTSVALLKYYENPEAHEKVSIGNKKRYKDPKEHEKTSITQLKRFEDPKEHEKLSIAQLKRFEDPKEREKLSIVQLKRFEDPKEREKQRIGLLKRFEDSEAHERISVALLKYYEDPEAHEKARVAKLKWNNDNPEQAKIDYMKAGIASCISQDGLPSSIEFKMRKILIDNNYKFSTNVGVLSFCVPDIVFREEKVIIQCDGDYWHDYPNGLDKDYEQDKILKSNGWQVIRFWEHEINNDIEKCLEEFEWKTFKRFNS